jgi:predicted transcriptional regulator
MDLQKIILELLAEGVTQTEIAKHIGSAQATVSRYATGKTKSCEYSVGVALIQLHKRRVGSAGATRAARKARAIARLEALAAKLNRELANMKQGSAT